MKNLEAMEKKYCDEIYPPVWSSLSRMNGPELKNIRWKRISDIFPGKYLNLWNTENKVSICPGACSKSMATANCLNSIKHNNFLL